MFEPNLQVPYSQTWTAGWQRKLSNDFAIEARYVGTRSDQEWIEYEYNEINLVENGLLNEFRLAQANLQSHIAAGCGTTGQPACSFAYRGAGTNPLPISLAYLSGRADATNTAAYTGTNWTSTTFVNPLARFNPAPGTFADALDSTAALRQNGLTAGLPANFLVANPDYLGGAEVIGNGGGSRYHSFQFEVRKRLSHGLQFNGSYVYGRQYDLQSDSLRSGWQKVLDTGTLGNVAHAIKANWTYELPFGQGRRFASSVGPWMDRLIGGWSFDGVARIQSGRDLQLQGVRLVGISEEDFRKEFKIRFDDAGQVVYNLPQDIIDNTVKAFSVSATSATGYGADGAPSGRYIAPGFGPDCLSAVANINECTPDPIEVRGPRLTRFDLSAVKRTTIKGRVNAEFRAEMLNAFNTPWFTPVLSASNNPVNHRVTAAGGNRTMQLVFRLNY